MAKAVDRWVQPILGFNLEQPNEHAELRRILDTD